MTEYDEFDVSTDGYFTIIPEWVLDADISDRAVRLYGVLRRHANTRLMSRPSRAKLAERMRTSLSSVDRALRELEAIGAVTIRHRWANSHGTEYVFGKDAEHLIPAPSAYLLHNSPAPRNPGGLVTSDGTPLVTSDHTVSSPVTTPLSSPVEGGVSSPVTHELEPLEPKPVKKETPRSRRASDDDPEGFAEFWAVYPRRQARGTAVKAYAKAIKKADPAEILAGARRYAADPDRTPKFTAHAATWLNRESWTDEPFLPMNNSAADDQVESDIVARLIKMQQENK